MRQFSIFPVLTGSSISRDNFQFSNNKGFTLIELLIAITIIGILSALLMANFVGIRQRARDAQRKSDLTQIKNALEIYRADQFAYPASLPAACGGVLTGGTPATTYMAKVPCDPLDNTLYTYTLTGSNYTLIACLENGNDQQKDNPNVAPCNGSSRFSYTVINP